MKTVRTTTHGNTILVRFYDENGRLVYNARGTQKTYFDRFVTTYLERYGKLVETGQSSYGEYLDYELDNKKYSELLEILKMIRPREWRLYKKLLGCLEGSKKCDNLAREATIEKIAEVL